MGTEIDRYSKNFSPTGGFSDTIVPPAGFELDHIHITKKDGTTQDITVPLGSELSYLLTLPAVPTQIEICVKEGGKYIYLGHFRGDFSPVFDFTFAQKFSDFSFILPLGSITGIIGWKFSTALTSASHRLDWAVRPTRTKAELLADIAAVTSGNFSIMPVKSSYADVSISEGSIWVEVPNPAAVSPFSTTLNFGGLSQDAVFGFKNKNINFNSATAGGTINTMQFRLRTSKNTDWNSISLATLTHTALNSAISALSAGVEFEMQVFVTYTSTNTSGTITFNWNLT